MLPKPCIPAASSALALYSCSFLFARGCHPNVLVKACGCQHMHAFFRVLDCAYEPFWSMYDVDCLQAAVGRSAGFDPNQYDSDEADDGVEMSLHPPGVNQSPPRLVSNQGGGHLLVSPLY